MASRRRLVPVLILALALVAAGGLWTTLQRRAASTRFEAGLVFVAGACDLSPGVARTLGGPLTTADCASVERIARAEVAAAFAGLRMDVTADPAAFWTVHVRAFVPSRSRMVGAAGASLAFGPLGGRGMVGIMPLTAQALRHAPSDASRADIVAAIGRGVGRSVVHESRTRSPVAKSTAATPPPTSTPRSIAPPSTTASFAGATPVSACARVSAVGSGHASMPHASGIAIRGATASFTWVR